MSRQAQLVWPILVLVVSFMAVFGISQLSSTPRPSAKSEPTAIATETAPPASPTVVPPPAPDAEATFSVTGKILTLTLTGAVDLPGVFAPDPGDQQNQSTRCLDKAFLAAWIADNAKEWSEPNNQQCLKQVDWGKNGPLVLRFHHA